VPITQDIGQLEGLKIDPAVYDVSQIRSDMDTVVGVSDAARGTLIKPKTATEADIISQAMGSRVDEKRDVNEDLISEMAEAALEIALRDMSKEEASRSLVKTPSGRRCRSTRSSPW
jgi:CheY-specific phosphatase CheX